MSIRYTEPKDRSAELLRVALGHMGRQAAAFNPITFTLWYEYAAGSNRALTMAVDALLSDALPLNDETVQRLYQENIAPPETAAVERIGGELQRVMTGIATTASQAGTRAGLFGTQLSDLSAALQGSSLASLSPQLTEAMAGTAAMKSSADALQQRVAAGQLEIARLRADLDRARDEALLDPLTGILNRKGFDLRLGELLQQPPADRQQHWLVMFDIDHFKQVNDLHGHVIGDRVIQGLGELLRHSLTDEAQCAARYGGEEFAVVVPNGTLATALQIAEQVRARAKAMKIRKRNSQDVLFSITVSGGVTAMRLDDDAMSWIARADGALYASKNNGRDRISTG